ncbi:MAG: extracellular solute-binding protein, partial [Chloroflexota bacterium]|nr:extracellular solute-binding protein [Chloroflexota bacterium]
AAPTAVPAESAAATSAPAIGEAALQGEISYYTYDLGPANASREEAIKIFQQQHPSAKVNLTVLPYGDLWDKVAAQFAAGQPPDVIYGDFSLLRYALKGELYDMTERVQIDPVLTKPDNFTISMTDPIQAKYGSQKIHALLLGTWVPILYYNRDIFDAAKVEYPNEEWTWEDLREAAVKLTNRQAETFGFQFGTTYDNTGWLWWSHKPSDFWATPQIYPERTIWNSDAGKGVMQIYRDLSVQDKSAITPDENSGYDVYAGAFGAGKVAMYAGGDWDAGWSFRDLSFKWGMSFLPKVQSNYRPSLNTMVASNVIAASTPKPDLAWEFVRFLSTTPEGQTLIGQGAYETPVLKDAANSKPVMQPEWAPPGYDVRVRAAQLPGPMYTPYALNLNLWEFPEKFLDPTVLKVRKGELSPGALPARP